MKKSKVEITKEMKSCFLAHIKMVNRFLIEKKIVSKRAAKRFEKNITELLIRDEYSEDGIYQVMILIHIQPELDKLVMGSMWAIANQSSKNIQEAIEATGCDSEYVNQSILDSRKLLKIYEEVNHTKFDNSGFIKKYKKEHNMD